MALCALVNIFQQLLLLHILFRDFKYFALQEAMNIKIPASVTKVHLYFVQKQSKVITIKLESSRVGLDVARRMFRDSIARFRFIKIELMTRFVLKESVLMMNDIYTLNKFENIVIDR